MDTVKERIWIIAAISALAASIGGMIKAESIYFQMLSMLL